MGFQVSPGVEVKEIDLTNVIPAVSTSIGGFAGYFKWGPMNEVTLISSEKALLQKFGTPDSSELYADPFFQAASFLSYGDALKVVRGGSSASFANATDNGGPEPITYTIGSLDVTGVIDGSYSVTIEGQDLEFTVVDEVATIDTNIVGLTEDPADFVLSGAAIDDYQLDDVLVTGGVVDGDYVGTIDGNEVTITVTGGVVTSFTPVASSTVNPLSVDADLNGDASPALIVSFDLVWTDNTPSEVNVEVTSAAEEQILDGVWIPNEVYFEDFFTDPESGTWAAKYPGAHGNGIQVFTISKTRFEEIDSGVTATFDAVAVVGQSPDPIGISVNDKIYVSGELAGTVKSVDGTAVEVSGSSADFVEGGVVTIGSDQYDISNVVNQYADETELAVFNVFDNAPEEDQLHVAVVDGAGNFGEAGAVVEKFADLSVVKTAKTSAGATNYIKNVINARSKYVYLIKGDTTDLLVADFAGEYTLTGGFEATTEDKLDSDTVSALDLLGDVETEDVNLLFSQIMSDGALLQNYTHQMAYTRKDAVAFLSPKKSATVGNISPLADVLEFAKGTGDQSITKRDNDGSYGVIDSGAVYIYDRYNDVYRYIPANGHIAGLCANTDDVAEPWFSPAGYNRGGLRGIVKIAFNPQQAQRDELYKAGINPIVTQPGQGTILFGDKTAQAKPSAFDRINVRRLFIVLEKAIATAAKYQLFELNDEFTRASFRNAVEPFLRDVKGRRGLYDFAVICDESNNTGEVIDTNRFVADIYIKPARSINFITLNFIATRTGVDFSEIAGLSNA